MSKLQGHVELVKGELQAFSTPVDLKISHECIKIGHLARLASFRASDPHHVNFDQSSRSHVDENFKFLKEKFDSGKTIYGVNTGYGGSADVLNNNDIQNQKALVQHLNAGVTSRTLAPGIVKAAMLVRASSLSLGRSGVRSEVIELLCGMINHDIIPVVPLRGSLSSSGDLMPLSYIAALMNGSKKDFLVYYKGVKNVTGEEAFKKAGLSFIEFRHKEGLAVVNAASVASSLASDNLFHFGYLMLLTEVVTAMSMEALQGRMETFDSLVYECLRHVGMKEVSENINLLLDESKLVRPLEQTQAKLNESMIDGSTQMDEMAQDRYGLRTSPQWLSSVVETYKESVRRLRVEINSTCDNPLVDHISGRIIHAGNFQGVNITVAMDQTRQGVQMCGKLLFAQLSEVLNNNMNLILPPNLSGIDHCKDYGFKGLDTSLAAYQSELDSITNPMTNHVLSAEMHNQSVNSMALVSGRKTQEGLELLRLIIAGSLLSLCQAMDLRWLRMQVSYAWATTLNEFGAADDICKTAMKKLWYHVAFRFNAVSADLDVLLEANSLRGKAEDREKLIAIFRKKCEESVRKLYEGGHEGEVAQILGRGTRRIYNFVRKELHVKFNNGDEPVDVGCNAIHESLDTDELRALLNDIF